MNSTPNNPQSQDVSVVNPAVEAVSFTRATEVRQGLKFRIRLLPTLIAVIFLGLAVVAGFMFTAKAINFKTDPTADVVSVRGGFAYALGGRFLMLRGKYTVQVEKEGYETLIQEFEVTDAPDQDIPISLKKLPGILTISTSPKDDIEILVDQKSVGRSPLTLDSISAGIHDISIRSERFMPYDTEIEIEGRRQEQVLGLSLQPAWAVITIKTFPDSATVLVDDVDRGATPLSIEIIQGTRLIKTRLPGYKVWQTELVVVPSEEQTLPLINLVKSDGKLSLRSTPTGANVTISGKYMGQTPIDLSLAPGDKYAMVLSKAGFQQVTRSINIAPDEDISLNINLKPVLGVVQLVVTPTGAELIVDGTPKGDPNQRLHLSAADHDIEIRMEGFATFKTTITPRPGFDQQLKIALKTVAQAKAESIKQLIVTAAGQQLKFVVPSDLLMGASRREPGRRSNEVLKTVKLTKPFYAGILEVTNKQYKLFDPGHDSGQVGRSLLNQDERPVVNLSWKKAAAYCNWLSAQDSLPAAYERVEDHYRLMEPRTTGYRLLTEAEWAWIARYAGGKPTRFPWGDAMPPTESVGNFADANAAGLVPYYLENYSDGYSGTAPPGSYAANAIGIYDLGGNVAEWISDIYEASPATSAVLVDPVGPSTGEYHVIRGASFMHGRFSELRWTYRDYGNEDRPDVGFRIARYLE